MKLLLVVLGLSACTSSGGDSSEFEESAAAAEGIYQVQAYTRNEALCAPGGESVLGDERFAAVFRGEVLGIPFLDVISCASAADCRDKVALARSGNGFTLDFSFTLTGVSADGALTGAGATTGFGDGAICRDAELTTTLLTIVDGSFRLDQTIIVAADFPVDSDGFCTTRNAQQAAEGVDCSKMEELTATFFESL